MPTSYSPNLKLALPSTGELSGTWGTTVNNNITSMIEEAITGRAALSAWVSNALTITTSNGTSSSGRCMVLDLSGTLTAAGTLTVPSANKLYIVRNGTTGGYAVTVTMGSGTTVSVANGETVMVYVDGTNVKVAITTVSKADTVTTNANLTGDVTSVGNATTLTNAPVIAKVLTGYTSGAGVISASDSILQAIQKLNGNDATNANLTGDVTSVGNATTLTNAPVIAKVLTGYTSGSGTVASTDSILQAIQKLNGNISKEWSIKTTTYTAVSGNSLFANTTSVAFTITLPATPSTNDFIRISDYAGTFATNNLTVGRNSSKIMGLSEDLVISTNNASITLVYIDSTQGWRIV